MNLASLLEVLQTCDLSGRVCVLEKGWRGQGECLTQLRKERELNVKNSRKARDVFYGRQIHSSFSSLTAVHVP